MAQKKSFLLRINPQLYEVLEKWAADEFRSVNAHIEFLLRDAALRSGRLGSKGKTARQETGENDLDQLPPEEQDTNL
ncbi:MAG TPA: hypothetical protein PLG09_02470 [Syntrophomonadaceae bacterium]|nr:hypothetical protein [Syntrophomonadaceae bacterium]HPU47895.1 hypothetical protein [Syntrophomonadaceae bacterium]